MKTRPCVHADVLMQFLSPTLLYFFSCRVFSCSQLPIQHIFCILVEVERFLCILHKMDSVIFYVRSNIELSRMLETERAGRKTIEHELTRLNGESTFRAQVFT